MARTIEYTEEDQKYLELHPHKICTKGFLYNRENPQGKIFDTPEEMDQAVDSGLWVTNPKYFDKLRDPKEPEKRSPGRPKSAPAVEKSEE